MAVRYRPLTSALPFSLTQSNSIIVYENSMIFQSVDFTKIRVGSSRGFFRRKMRTKFPVAFRTVPLLWLVVLFMYSGSYELQRLYAAFYSEDPETTTPKLSAVLLRPNVLTAADLRRLIPQLNKEQVILNSHNITWPPVLTNTSSLWPEGIVLVVQVHKRLSYLEKLISSLSNARYIDRALLIFSHDFYDEELNKKIRSIKFCAVLQIFFPYSIQAHPLMFPGDSPRDCPKGISKEKALASACINAEWPDIYGHYREARYSQTKHHWWWKGNYIFSQVRILQNYRGFVVFFEEDHYVAEDFLHVLWLQQQLTQGTHDCPACSTARILSLGSYPKTYSYLNDGSKVELLPWVSTKHNMGMALNRSTWFELVSCSETFCTVDDYNWDWSLQHVAQRCFPTNPKTKSRLNTLVLKAPRVFHIGVCGVHHQKVNCDPQFSPVVRDAEHAQRLARKHNALYPKNLAVNNQLHTKAPRLNKGNGGWGDKRDQQLCLSMSLPQSNNYTSTFNSNSTMTTR